MAGDPFTIAVFRWLTAVNTDADLPAGAMKLAYAISQYINRDSRTAWPSHETLVSAAGFHEGENATRNVRRLTKALVDRGHLLTTRRRQSSLVYRLAQDRTELSYQEVNSEAEDKSRPDFSDRSGDQDRTISTVRPDIICHQDRTELSAKLPNELLKNYEGESRARADFIPDDFKVSDETYGWALERLGSNEAVDRSLERFCNHFRQVDGSKSKSRDWNLKARNWIDEDLTRNPPDKSVHSAGRRLHDKVRSFDAGPTDRESRQLAAFARGASRQLSDKTGNDIDLQSDEKWEAVLCTYVKFGHWTKHIEFGPSPDDPECFAPQHLLAKHGITKAVAA